ncbi:MAG: hypothetical protein ACYDG5_08500 [Dehalococcoidales bacterium]
MKNNNQDKMIRAYTILTALKKTVEIITMQHILETYVDEYHSALDKLADTGIDVSEYRIPDSYVKVIIDPHITHVQSFGAGPERYTYTKEKYVDKPYFLMKLDEVISYFEFLMSPGAKRIGFHKPEE